MGIKKNIIYNSILTVSNYIIPLLVFPYISRILGVENLGLYSFVDGAINYYLLFSMMGITTIGIREVAKYKDNPIELSKSFSSMIALNSISTITILLIFVISIIIVPQFSAHKEMFYVGGVKILFSLFLIEWLYIGSENFRFITYRTITIRVIYVIFIFIFVRDKDDYDIYYTLTVFTLVGNAIINWIYGRRITKFSFKSLDITTYLKPFFTLGLYGMLNSMYTSFNLIYLGFVSDQKEVGYYATAIKLHGIFLALFTAYSAVIMPHISSLIAQKKMTEVRLLITKSFESLYLFSIPLIYISISLAPQIIHIISGQGYDGAILPLQIILPLVLLIGIGQILIVQILIPLQKDKAILINSLVGAFVGIILNFLLVSHYKSIGASIVWVISEFAVFFSAQYFVNKTIGINIAKTNLIKHLIFSLPYFMICILVKYFFRTDLNIVILALTLSILYFSFIQIKVLKNALVLSIFIKLVDKFKIST